MVDINLVVQIISIIVILVTLGITYGKLSTKVDFLTKQVERMNGCVSDNRDNIQKNSQDISRLEGRMSSVPKDWNVIK